MAGARLRRESSERERERERSLPSSRGHSMLSALVSAATALPVGQPPYSWLDDQITFLYHRTQSAAI